MLHSSSLRIFAISICGSASIVAAASTIQVSSPTELQKAIDACDSGCRIELAAPEYVLTRPVLVLGKRDIQIVGTGSARALLRWDESLLKNVANPLKGSNLQAMVPKLFTLSWKDISGSDDPARPAGWLMWPFQGSESSLGTNGPMGSSTDTSSPYSTNGFQRNGMILVEGSRDILFQNLELDGVKQAYFDNRGVWSQKYDVFFGNVGINLFQSLRIRITDSDIHHFWSALYLNGRNTRCHSFPNPDDLDFKSILRMASCGIMGSHLVENNRFHSNWWVAFSESEWDMGSVFRDNLAWKNQQDTTFPFGSLGNTEKMDHVGGFLFMKDAIYPSHVVSGNTFLETPTPLAHMGWRYTSNTVFADNLIGPIPRNRLLDWHQLLGYAISRRTFRNVLIEDSTSGAYRFVPVSKVLVGTDTVVLDPPANILRDYALPFNWKPLTGKRLQAQGIQWFDSLAADSIARLRLPRTPLKPPIDTTDNLRWIVAGQPVHDTSAADFGSLDWRSPAVDSFILGKGFLGRTAGFVQPTGSPSVKGLLWSSGTPFMDKNQTLHLPLQIQFVGGAASLVLQDLVISSRQCRFTSEPCTDSLIPIALSSASYLEQDQELQIQLAGRLSPADSILQVDLWAGAVVDGNTLPLTPATWTWAKGMAYSNGRGPVSGIESRSQMLRVGSVRRQSDRWIFTITGIPANASISMVDVSGRHAMLSRIDDHRYAVDAVHRGTWFLRIPGQPAQRVFLAP